MQTPEAPPVYKSPAGWRLLTLLLLLVAAAAALLFLPLQELLSTLQAYIQDAGWRGIAVYVLVYIGFTVALLPSAPLSAMAGLMFGFAAGLGAAVLGSNLGALAAFLLARTLLRRRVEAWSRELPQVASVTRAVGENGLKAVVLLRCAPLVPFGAQNYILGCTPVPLWKYALGSLAGMLPMTAAVVYIGSLGRLAAGQKRPEQIALGIFGGLAALAAIVFFSRLAKRALREAERNAGGAEGMKNSPAKEPGRGI